MTLLEKFAQQFQKPEGFWGRVAGHLMSKGREKSEWTVSLLDVQKDDRVLEIGFGPGVAIEMLAAKITDGHIAGMDYSEVMLKQAEKRNAAVIAEGLVDLKWADVSDMPPFDECFDKILTVNNFMFWQQPVAILRDIHKILKPGGKIAITIQPKMKGATDRTTEEFGHQIAHDLQAAGYSNIRTEMKEMKPIATICVIGEAGKV